MNCTFCGQEYEFSLGHRCLVMQEESKQPMPQPDLVSKLREALQFVFEVVDLHVLHLGEYEASCDYVKQEQTWNCHGCEGIGYSRWPDWKLEFKHGAHCRYLAARATLLAIDKQPVESLLGLEGQAAEPRRDCNLSDGDTQCTAKWPHGDGYLNCRYIIGHRGKHKTCYDNGAEWETPPTLGQVCEKCGHVHISIICTCGCDISGQLLNLRQPSPSTPIVPGTAGEWWKAYSLCSCGHGILDHDNGPVMAFCGQCRCTRFDGTMSGPKEPSDA